MTLTPEQVKEIKKQINEQIKHLPKDQQELWKKQIDSMSDDELEQFVAQQMQASQSSSSDTQAKGQSIFRSIVSGEIPSKKLDENSQAMAVLSVKSISKGHTIIIPKKSATSPKDLPTQAFTLAKKIAKKISSKLKANSCEIQTEFAFGEIVLHVIPVYDKPLNINSPRTDASEEELEQLEKLLKVVKKPKVIRPKKIRQKEIIKLPRRIP